MLLTKFINLLNLAPQFTTEFKNRFIKSFEESTNIQKFHLIAEIENILRAKGLLN